MRMNYFGDSYDIVKQSMLRWLIEFGNWQVHPMFTHAVSPSDVRAFEAFLGVLVLTQKVLRKQSERRSYLSSSTFKTNIFYDPDTGLRMKSQRVRSTAHLYADELAAIVGERADSLTMVFDQSLPRGSEEKSLIAKMAMLRDDGMHCFAYQSHASFWVVGNDAKLVSRARTHLQRQSRLPSFRLLTV